MPGLTRHPVVYTLDGRIKSGVTQMWQKAKINEKKTTTIWFGVYTG